MVAAPVKFRGGGDLLVGAVPPPRSVVVVCWQGDLVSPLPLPPAARAVAEACTRAVDAATAQDAQAYAEAVARLVTLDRERVNEVLGSVVRRLLEELHPDGLDADDAQQALERAVRGVVGWFPQVDVTALVVVLGGSLGLHPDSTDGGGEAPPVTPLDVARHAPLLVADLLAARRRPLRPYLDAAFAEIARAETVELP